MRKKRRSDKFFQEACLRNDIPEQVLPGCYYLTYRKSLNSDDIAYEGTMRIDPPGADFHMSGDLYQMPAEKARASPAISGEIPIFCRADYRCYVRVDAILEAPSPEQFAFRFRKFYLDKIKAISKKHTSNSSLYSHNWAEPKVLYALLTRQWQPPAHQAPYFSGKVYDDRSQPIGELSMTWLTDRVRRAEIVMDKEVGVVFPSDNGMGADWKSVFGAIGWHIDISKQVTDIPTPCDSRWSNAELHSYLMSRRKDNKILDEKWQYHLLCVSGLVANMRGIMYDFGNNDTVNFDTNNTPREGAAVVYPTKIQRNWDERYKPKEREQWQYALYFRVAVHEIGHAMHLYHNQADKGFMNTTDKLAEDADFPENIEWAFSQQERRFLRHLPDIFVRPGGMPFDMREILYVDADIRQELEDTHYLQFIVRPANTNPLFGAPLRVDLELVHKKESNKPYYIVPISLNFKSGYLNGYVDNPLSADLKNTVNRREFNSIVLHNDQSLLRRLEPGDSVFQSVTLLSGKDGCLFPCPGLHQITFELAWQSSSGEVYLLRQQSIVNVVLPTPSDSHPVPAGYSKFAQDLINCREAFLMLVIKSGDFKEGVQKVEKAVRDVFLGPHYQYILARIYAESYKNRSAEIDKVCQYIDDSTVMSISEIGDLATVLLQSAEDTTDKKKLRRLARKLHDKFNRLKVTLENQTAVENIEKILNRLPN